MRCFVACFVQPQSASRLRTACPDIAGVRWLPTENYHVTLRFLGTVADEQVDGLLDVVSGLEGPAPICQVTGLQGYPRATSARALVAELRPEPTLTNWNTWLRAQTPSNDDTAREFAPHITVARTRNGVSLPAHEGVAGIPVALSKPGLYRSVTKPEGATYQRLESRSAR